MADRFQNALAQVAFFIVVTQFAGLVNAGGSARRGGGAAKRTVHKRHLGLDGRVAARIENFPAINMLDSFAHFFSPCFITKDFPSHYTKYSVSAEKIFSQAARTELECVIVYDIHIP